MPSATEPHSFLERCKSRTSPYPDEPDSGGCATREPDSGCEHRPTLTSSVVTSASASLEPASRTVPLYNPKLTLAA
jgi:hypothetical protein